jgi:hypothetical protein
MEAPMMRQTTARSIPPKVVELFNGARQLTTVERLALAKLLLDSILVDQSVEETDWSMMGLEAFQKDWDNADDAVYDHWRELYDVSPR